MHAQCSSHLSILKSLFYHNLNYHKLHKKDKLYIGAKQRRLRRKRRSVIYINVHAGVYIMQVNHIVSPPPLLEKSILHPQGGFFFGGGGLSSFCLIFSFPSPLFFIFSPRPIYFPCSYSPSCQISQINKTPSVPVKAFI